MSDKKLMVGGQAVIEGVMMRGPKLTATAVRDPQGKIQVETKPVNSISDRFPILKKPFLRGTVSLIESLVIGMKSLSYSAKMAGEEDEQGEDGAAVFGKELHEIEHHMVVQRCHDTDIMQRRCVALIIFYGIDIGMGNVWVLEHKL